MIIDMGRSYGHPLLGPSTTSHCHLHPHPGHRVWMKHLSLLLQDVEAKGQLKTAVRGRPTVNMGACSYVRMFCIVIAGKDSYFSVCLTWGGHTFFFLNIMYLQTDGFIIVFPNKMAVEYVEQCLTSRNLIHGLDGL